MTLELFELHLAQSENVLRTVEQLAFSDRKKKRHLQQLQELFEAIKQKYNSFDKLDLGFAKQCLDYFFLWDLEFLSHSSDSSYVPKELILCVEAVLKQWTNNPNSYIIVTSINSKFINYSFQSIPEDKYVILESFIDSKLKIKFDHKLIMINMPEPLAEDYLANVVLFHEIGHYIDKREKIVDRIFDTEPQFVALSKSGKQDEAFKFGVYKNYFKEYFADIFASQYINDACNKYINYIAHEQQPSLTHPATNDRIKIVEDFLSGTANSIVDVIQQYTLGKTGKQLQKRFSAIQATFDKENTITVTNESELFSLFIRGWDCWTNSSTEFPRKLKSGLLDGYRKLNELIKQSIEKYFGI